eukprot:3480121-Lingulodinium_polyedra.AAC.1
MAPDSEAVDLLGCTFPAERGTCRCRRFAGALEFVFGWGRKLSGRHFERLIGRVIAAAALRGGRRCSTRAT